MTMVLDETWDLNTIFPGGSASTEFARFLDQLQDDIASAREKTERIGPDHSLQQWAQLITDLQSISARFRQSEAFVECLLAQNLKDKGAKVLEGRVSQTNAAKQAVMTTLESKFRSMSAEAWQALLAHPLMEPIAFDLQERRSKAADQMPADREALAAALAVDGYHAWGHLYDTIVGRMTMTLGDDGETGKTETLSMGQAFNRMSDARRSVRETVYRKWEDIWTSHEDLCAAALNGIAGYRLALYDARGWSSELQEPLSLNRMSQETLDTMWRVIAENKAPFVRYLERKAKLLGLARLDWHDVSAPLSQVDKKISYDEAKRFVADNFRKFSPKMADFAEQCFQRRWVEAEDRADKQSGAFCTSFPVTEETRVFMTFSGTTGNVSTLAHELGHAYHQHVMRGLPEFAQQYAMNVAETASTFAEAIISDASIREASNDAERIALLDDKIERAVAMFMNIHARFLFESKFYQERRDGLVTADRLNELMVEAQQEAYLGALGTYHPHFWASKLHFYLTDVPFYNFPYTFGYCFSAGIYARALQEGPAFADRYVELLRDTGRMTVEDLAKKHLGVDLRQPEFWLQAVGLAAADVDEFLQLTADND